MSTPADDPQRMALLEAAARVIDTEGLAALTTRRLATEIGRSTMAIYTVFGGKEALVQELLREAFRRFGRVLSEVTPSDDPLDDLVRLARAYRSYALANPSFYRLMFDASGRIAHLEGDDLVAAQGTFLHLVAAIERVMTAGRFRSGNPFTCALRCWAQMHGAVSLEVIGFELAGEELYEDVLAAILRAET